MSTDLENFHATVSHQRPDRILYYASFTPDLERRVREHVGGGDIAEHYGFYSPVHLEPPRREGAKPIDYSPYWEGQDLPEGTTFDERGVAMQPSGFYHFWGYISPLRNATSLKEIEDYPLDDFSNCDFGRWREQVEAAHAAGRVASVFIGHMYENAWQIRGYEQFLLDTIERPAWAECLLQRLAEQDRILAREAAAAGADLIRCGDDVANQRAMMFAPDTWRRMIHDRWRVTWAQIKSARPQMRIWYHSDGNILPIIGELVDAGLDILNPLQPECLDMDEVHRRFGGQLTFDGLMGTQSTMPWGKPGDVRARVREIIDRYGQSGGLIISPTHVLEPEVPLENIDAYAEACREFGAGSV
ncbi:MAG: methylcobalamin:coenzyme M methyltransferase [Planctomycetes bacterium ADurb.Bin126]|nr:MAG: methylcobalamin:coenzyme M methyltransferase [Planctomycetes bacterium ADurb.Bin126]HOD83765.1 uroporphyrinogen decarboxylase family protein [Phycisphaerae bacterium]HQL72982.1 uroporphyrinogen decarboxylase family protein [Phycisphaerae bacterium]